MQGVFVYMNKKKLTIVLSSLFLLLFLSGCSNSSELISLSTPISDVKADGFLTVILTYPLAQAINYLSVHVGVFWAITIVTLVLNAIILALTFKSNVAMQKMQEVQPEIQKIQLKYEGRTDSASQQKAAMEMQKVYAKYNINPMTSMLATFIQFPILISMYAAVRRSAEVKNGSFFGYSLDLTPREAFVEHAWILIVIFVLMIVFQLLSVSIVRWLANSRAKNEAEKHHKHYEKPKDNTTFMTYGMTAFIGVIMLSWPTALSLYYCIYSVINIVKSIVIDKMSHKD